MITKTCPKCGESKQIEEFAYSHRYNDKRQSHCRTCSNAAGIKNYQENKARYKAKAVERNKVMRERLRVLKSVPCADCKNTYDPVCMDFDHLPEFDKSHNISYMMRHRMAWDKVLAEVAKCEVVCSNCHRLRTRDRLDVTD